MQIMAQETVTVRIDSELKSQVAALSERLGFNTSTAVNAFFRAFVQAGGFPFKVTLGESAKEREEINRILDERQAIVDNGQAVWLDGETQVKKMIGL